jgi:hypothetical protein
VLDNFLFNDQIDDGAAGYFERRRACMCMELMVISALWWKRPLGVLSDAVASTPGLVNSNVPIFLLLRLAITVYSTSVLGQPVYIFQALPDWLQDKPIYIVAGGQFLQLPRTLRFAECGSDEGHTGVFSPAGMQRPHWIRHLQQVYFFKYIKK